MPRKNMLFLVIVQPILGKIRNTFLKRVALHYLGGITFDNVLGCIIVFAPTSIPITDMSMD